MKRHPQCRFMRFGRQAVRFALAAQEDLFILRMGLRKRGTLSHRLAAQCPHGSEMRALGQVFQALTIAWLSDEWRRS